MVKVVLRAFENRHLFTPSGKKSCRKLVKLDTKLGSVLLVNRATASGIIFYNRKNSFTYLLDKNKL